MYFKQEKVISDLLFNSTDKQDNSGKKKVNTLFNSTTFYWSACTKPGKWVVMYLCVRGIDFASFYDFDIWFWNCSNSGIFSHFIVIMKKRYIDFIQTTSILKYQYIW